MEKPSQVYGEPKMTSGCELMVQTENFSHVLYHFGMKAIGIVIILIWGISNGQDLCCPNVRHVLNNSFVLTHCK